MLKARQTLGKYRIERRLAEGGFAVVYRAYDTIEGIPVALKVPRTRWLSPELMNDLRREVRVNAKLEHPNVLAIKNACIIDDCFVIAYPLGDGALEERLRRRMSAKTALGLAEQMLEAVAYAHEQRVIHCDIKPDNFILFPDGELRLGDFGIARVALRTRTLASGAGTVGYIAPEQALGRPSYRSDVFSLGVVMWRMFSGELPEWPYEWPPPGIQRVRANYHADMEEFLRRALLVDERRRYRDAIQMLAAFQRLKGRAIRRTVRPRRQAPSVKAPPAWRTLRLREFRRQWGKALEARSECGHCAGPVSEAMSHCPWCGTAREMHRGGTPFPVECGRCGRGMKRDWRFCAHCYGGAVSSGSSRQYADVRYSARCVGPRCTRRELMPFMRYCPWCRTKVRKPWAIPGSRARCGRCKWGTLPEFWDHCPWCGKRQERR